MKKREKTRKHDEKQKEKMMKNRGNKNKETR